jgi:hypothetical protein
MTSARSRWDGWRVTKPCEGRSDREFEEVSTDRMVVIERSPFITLLRTLNSYLLMSQPVLAGAVARKAPPVPIYFTK